MKRHSSRIVALLLAAGLAVAVAGCQAPGNAPRTAASGKPSQPQENDPAINWQDPCATNLTGIVEQLLLYYSQRHRLPDSLDQLPARTLAGDPLRLTCPASGKPYLYNARDGGYHASPDLIPSGMTLILYDADPVHLIARHITDGKYDYEFHKSVRYGIVMVPPAPNHAVQMFVVPIEDTLLDVYLKSAPPK